MIFLYLFLGMLSRRVDSITRKEGTNSAAYTLLVRVYVSEQGVMVGWSRKGDPRSASANGVKCRRVTGTNRELISCSVVPASLNCSLLPNTNATFHGLLSRLGPPTFAFSSPHKHRHRNHNHRMYPAIGHQTRFLLATKPVTMSDQVADDRYSPRQYWRAFTQFQSSLDSY